MSSFSRLRRAAALAAVGAVGALALTVVVTAALAVVARPAPSGAQTRPGSRESGPATIRQATVGRPVAFRDRAPLRAADLVAHPAFARKLAAALTAEHNRQVAAYLQAVAERKAAQQRAAEQRAAEQRAARAEQARTVRRARSAPAVRTGGRACGGDLPPCCVMKRESHGNPRAVNPSSGASGKWQFMDATWNDYLGYPTAASAPVWVQDQKARQVWAGGAGASHWGGGC